MIRDEREELPFPVTGAELLLGEKCFDEPSEDIIFISPSVRRERECVKRLFSRGAVACSDMELFFSEKPENVFAVTGSDGKSTTSALIGRIFSTSGKEAYVCGNFGLPLSPLSEKRGAYFVTELSSFMLRYAKPRSRRALITNITPNHLNWHKDFEEYKESKKNLLKNGQERVFSFDCQNSRELINEFGAYALFSVSTPFRELKKEIKAEVYCTLENGVLLKNGEPVIEREKIPLVGIHNVKNALAAICMTDDFCSVAELRCALSSFTGLEHRCKTVYEKDGVRYYDSSIDSSPERTRATLASFDRPVTVILGGKDKGLDYAPLAEALPCCAVAVILCGENAERLAEFISEKRIPCPVFFANNYIEAVTVARSIGCDTVLSPASTSFDRFSNFEERGREFLKSILEVYK